MRHCSIFSPHAEPAAVVRSLQQMPLPQGSVEIEHAESAQQSIQVSFHNPDKTRVFRLQLTHQSSSSPGFRNQVLALMRLYTAVSTSAAEASQRVLNILNACRMMVDLVAEPFFIQPFETIAFRLAQELGGAVVLEDRVLDASGRLILDTQGHSEALEEDLESSSPSLV